MVKDRYTRNSESTHDDGDAGAEFGHHLDLAFPASLLDSLVVGLVGIDEDQRIRYFNPGAERIFRLDREAVLGKSLDLLIPTRFHAAHADQVRRCAAGENETRLEYMRPRITGRRGDGSEFPAEATIAKYSTAAGTRLLAIVRDLEDEIGIHASEDPGVVRALQTVHAVEQVLVNAVGERELIEHVCAAITHIPGYVFAWAGYVDDGPRRAIRPITASGAGESHLSRGVALDLDDEPDPAPVRSAVETGELATVHELSRGHGLWPLGDVAEPGDFGSALALPLRRTGKVFGVLCVAAGVDHAFGESECHLLMRMVDQVAAGLMMRHAREASGLEPAIVDRLASIVLGTPDVLAFLDSSGNYFYLNPAGQELTGCHMFDRGALLSPGTIHPERAARILVDEAIPAALEHGRWMGDTVVLADGGEAVVVSLILIAHYRRDGQFECLAALMRKRPESSETVSLDARDDAVTDGDHGRLLDAAAADGGGTGNALAARVAQLKVAVFHRNRILLLDVDEVAWMQADHHYARVTTACGSYLSSLGLVDLEKRLNPAYFVRVHRSHLVNLSFALELERNHDHGYLILNLPDRPRVPISRSRMEHVREILGLT